MTTATEFETELKKTEKTNPEWAGFVRTSFKSEIEAGVRASLATSKWFGKLTGRKW